MIKLLCFIPPALVALLLLSGCGHVTSMLRKLPDGHFEGLEMNETGKFSSTTGAFEILDKDADVIRARGMDIRHSNAWVPNISVKSDVAVLDLSTAASKRANPQPYAAPPPAKQPTPGSD